MGAAKEILDFTKKHINTTVTFDYDVDIDTCALRVRDYENNTCFELSVDRFDGENNEDEVIIYLLECAEKDLFNKTNKKEIC